MAQKMNPGNEHTLCFAVQMNLKGIAFLEDQDYGKAISTFSESLSTLRRELGDTGQEYHGWEALPNVWTSFYSSRAMPMTCYSDTTEDVEDTPTFFQNPIKVQLTSRIPSQAKVQPRKVLSRLSFSLIFNLALAFHSSAIEKKRVSTKRLHKALELYKLASSVAQNALCLEYVEAIIITNNLGHIHELLGDYAKARECYNYILGRVINYVCTSNRESQCEAVHFEKILGNAMRTVQQKTKAAAAA